MRVYIVGNDPCLIDQVRIFFASDLEFMIDLAGDFAGLLNLIHTKGVPDILALDTPEALKIIKGLKQEAPYKFISMLTVIDAGQGLGEVKNLVEMGADVVIARPYTIDQFFSCLKKVIEKRWRWLEHGYDAVKVMSKMAEKSDGQKGHHVDRVANISYQIALALGLSDGDARRIGLAARLHDIGKLKVDCNILHKAERLSPEEFEKVKKHTLLGALIISQHPHNFLFHTAREIILSHHEKWNGGGYPFGLEKQQIPLFGRIVAAADVFDALTHKRDYKAVWTSGDTVEYIKAKSETQFDPRVVEILASEFMHFEQPKLLERQGQR